MKHGLLLAVLLTTGCIPFHRNGVTHHLVIGLGVVSVNDTNAVVAQLVRSQGLGFVASQNGVGLGYFNSATTVIHTNQNVLIEFSDVPGKPIKIEIPK